MSRIDRYGKLLFGKYYIGRFRGEDVVHETVYGFVKSGYWYAGGPENKPYDHLFYGVVWGWNWNFGIGLIRATEPINQPKYVVWLEDHNGGSVGEEYFDELVDLLRSWPYAEKVAENEYEAWIGGRA